MVSMEGSGFRIEGGLFVERVVSGGKEDDRRNSGEGSN